MRKIKFYQDNYYHIYNRGVDGRLTFIDNADRVRFINSIYLLNNYQTIPPSFDILNLIDASLLVSRETMVSISAGCLMDNHFHLVVRPLYENSVSKFFHKLGVSYTMYFNRKYERSGSLFESTFKAKHIDCENYANYLTEYIHFNPIDRIKENKTKSAMLSYLEHYPWSSFAYFVGSKSPFSILLNENFREKVLDLTVEQYREFVYDALEDKLET